MSIEPIAGLASLERSAAAPFLSDEEWNAVFVALRDAGRGRSVPTSPPGAVARGWRWLTGIEPPRPLADPRLDALRRFVVAVRGHRERIAEMLPELSGRGFSREQVEALARVVA